MARFCSRFGLSFALVLMAASAHANPVISFGVQAGQAATEALGGVVLGPEDAANVSPPGIVFGLLPVGEDLDGFHVRNDGTVLFSTTTAVTLDGTTYGAGDVVAFDGLAFTLVLDEGLFGTVENVDAVSELPNGNLLISTTTDATLFGFGFANGDVVEVDLVGGSAALYAGLNEAAMFTGTNQDIDALHYDRSNQHLIISVRTDGVGTIGGYAIDGTGSSSDLIDLDLSFGVAGSLYLDGAALFDGGVTRQIDAVYLIPECGDGLDNDGDGHTDFPDDIGCRFAHSPLELSHCSDGISNDADGLIDYDGGLWANGVATTAPDPECDGTGWGGEVRRSCGIGFEIVPFLLGIAWLSRRRGVRFV